VLNKKGSLNPAEWEWSAVTLRRALGSSIHCGRGSALGTRGGASPRALGRQRLPARAGRRADLPRRPHRSGRRRLRDHDHSRPYKRPMSVAAARAELVRCAGTQFDPAVVRALLNVSMDGVGEPWASPHWWPSSSISPIRSALFQLSTVAPSAVATGLAALPLVLTMPTPAQLGAHGNPLGVTAERRGRCNAARRFSERVSSQQPFAPISAGGPTATPAPASAPRSVPPRRGPLQPLRPLHPRRGPLQNPRWGHPQRGPLRTGLRPSLGAARSGHDGHPAEVHPRCGHDGQRPAPPDPNGPCASERPS